MTTPSDDTNRATNPTRVSDVFPHIHGNPGSMPLSLDPFTVTTQAGFLPFKPPQVGLPSAFAPLQDLCMNMSVEKPNGESGLLASYQLGTTVENLLPDLTDEIDQLVASDGQPDLFAVCAAFRDYSFVSSAYLLEPCWQQWNKDATYGLGRPLLPRQLAGPMIKCANLLSIPAFLSYAAGSTLFNYRFVDAQIGTSDYKNMRLIRAFEKGHNHTSSEAGFVLTHVDIVKHTGPLVHSVVQLLDCIATDSPGAVDALQGLINAMGIIEDAMDGMWRQSKPKDYAVFRTFIFGIKNQPFFPDGVVYAGYDNDAPQHFRGESGAYDATIPTLDAVLQIPMPNNPLTDVLKEFRDYRPRPQRDFLTYLRRRSKELHVKDYCLKDFETRILYLRVLDLIRSFRWKHWLFAREFIIRQTTHPVATGGSPIVTWLPNQLFAVMKLMQDVWQQILEEGRGEPGEILSKMMANVDDQSVKLEKEVQKWCSKVGSAAVKVE